MADQQINAADRGGDAADSNALQRTGAPTTGAAAAGDPTQTGGLITPDAGTGMHGRARDLTGVAVPPDLDVGADAQDVLTQVDGTYDANAGGTGAPGATATPDTLGGVGGRLGGISDSR